MELANLAVPSVYVLITFLAYTSQWLLLYLEPEPLSQKEIIRFNVLLVCLLICYTRSVFVDPGQIPRTPEEESEKENGKQNQPRKWCRKCDAAKPPRSHHCKDCKRCIPKMDHHCPWTQNCVSHTTFPHFMRFLFYAVVSMIYLWTLLWPRMSHLWANRHFPSYLGPSVFQLGHLFALCMANFVTLFALAVLLVRNIWCLAVNTTTIEGWEIERHKTLVRRARYFGGWLEGPDGVQVHIKKQEFPFDIGIWKNFVQGMGTRNVLAWFWPLAATPSVASGLRFETNGFEDPALSWPPPDPDRLHRKKALEAHDGAFMFQDKGLSNEETIAAFRRRQEEDAVRRRKPFVQRLEAQQIRERSAESDNEDGESESGSVENTPGGSQSGEEGWKNSEGERLRDFGVDEDVEFYDEEDDLPLSELIARKKAKYTAAADTL